MQIPQRWRQTATRLFGPWVLDVDRVSTRADAQAGLLGALVVLPQGIAFASLAGLPPAWGLYTSIVPCIVAALAGSSRLMVSGPTNATSLALAAMLAPLAVASSPHYPLLAVAVTLGVGLLQMALGLARLGALTNFISPAVLLGFTSGAAVLIAWHALVDMAQSWTALAVGVGTVAVALLTKPLFKAGQHLLLALIVGSAAAAGLAYLGWEADLVGAVPKALPAMHRPDITWTDLRQLAGISFALAIIALGQTVAIGKTLAARRGEQFDANRECVGQGLSNVTGAFFSCMVSCGSLNRTVVNEQSGARTPLAAVASGLMVIVLLAGAAPILSFIPLAAIAGLLLLVAWGLLDRAQWKRVLKLDPAEAAIAAGTFVATLSMSLETAILGGVVASLITYLYRSARPALRTLGFSKRYEDDPHRALVVIDDLPPAARAECPQLKLMRMEGSVYFGAVAHVGEQLHLLRTAPQAPRFLLVLCKGMVSVDLGGADLWEAELRQRREMGGDLFFDRPRDRVLNTWQRIGFDQRLGADHVFDSKRDALATVIARLDPDICARCTARIFDECRGRPGAAPPVNAAGEPAP